MNYFQSIKQNGSDILINDEFKCLQVINTLYGRNASYEYDYNENAYYLNTGGVNANDVVWGYQLKALDGLGVVSFHIRRWDNNTLRIRIFPYHDREIANDNWVARDDSLMNKLVLYALTENTNIPKTEHGAGIEIYGGDGKILFSSFHPTLKILHTSTEDGWKDDNSSSNTHRFSEPITFSGNGIFIPCGYNASVDRDQDCLESAPAVSVSGNTATCYYRSVYCTSRHRRPGPDRALFYSCFDYIVGEI